MQTVNKALSEAALFLDDAQQNINHLHISLKKEENKTCFNIYFVSRLSDRNS